MLVRGILITTLQKLMMPQKRELSRNKFYFWVNTGVRDIPFGGCLCDTCHIGKSREFIEIDDLRQLNYLVLW